MQSYGICFLFFSESEMSYDWMAIWITVLFYIALGIRFAYLKIAANYSGEAEVNNYKLFQILLISAFVAFVLDSLLIAGIDNQTSFLGYVVRRFIVTVVFTSSIYLSGTGGEYYENERVFLVPCYLLLLFQMILDLTWSLSTVLDSL